MPNLLPSSAPNNPEEHTRSPCRPWKVWGTIVWTVLALVANVIPVIFAEISASYLRRCCGYAIDLLPANHESIPKSLLFTSGTLVSIAVLAFAIHWRHCRFIDYLALVRPQRKQLLSAALILAVLLILGDFTSYLAGQVISPRDIETYKDMRDAGALLLWAFGPILAFPAMEELIFRGFLWRGLASSSVGVLGASIITSAVWASMHIQFEMFEIAQTFVLGLFLAWIRWRSSSAILTLILHALTNVYASAAIVLVAEDMM
jgi:membrane protease YdiL (CAAX protease family)